MCMNFKKHAKIRSYSMAYRKLKTRSKELAYNSFTPFFALFFTFFTD